MWPYWLMFVLPAAAALRGSASAHPAAQRRDRNWSPGLLAAFLGFALVIGYRHEVGGDWGAYQRHFDEGSELLTDPGYKLLNEVVAALGGGIHEVNLACGAIFSYCLVRFCRDLPRPWLALTVAVPYLVIVVGMGYTRQAVALAFGMLAIAMLRRRAVAWFVVWVVVGATFHKTAVLLLPIAALSTSKNRYWTVLWVGVIAVLAYQTLLADTAEELYATYINAEYQSEGAFVRAMMNALPGAVLLLWRRRFDLGRQTMLWRWLAIVSITLPIVLLVTAASTAVDRMALYMLPLQLVVFSHLPDVFGTRRASTRQLWVVAVLGYYLAVQFTWLNFATHSDYWLPYRFYPLEGLV